MDEKFAAHVLSMLVVHTSVIAALTNLLSEDQRRKLADTLAQNAKDALQAPPHAEDLPEYKTLLAENLQPWIEQLRT